MSGEGEQPFRVFLRIDKNEIFRDARQLCCQALEKLSEQDLEIYVGSEHEFACYETEKTKQFGAIEMHGIFNTGAVNHLGFKILNQVLPELDNLGVEICNFEKEYSAGQFEVALLHQEGIRSADSSFYFRQVLKEKFPENVTFLTKYTAEGLNNSCHFNFSLWETGAHGGNISKRNEDNLDPRNLNFLYGILTHLPSTLSIFSPTILCFNRLYTPHNWAPDLKNEDNPTGCVNLAFDDKASGISIKGNRIELRYTSSLCNPYLVLYAVVISGLHGLETAPELSSYQELIDYSKTVILPQNLMESLNFLKNNSIFPEKFTNMYYDTMRWNRDQMLKYQVEEENTEMMGTPSGLQKLIDEFKIFV